MSDEQLENREVLGPQALSTDSPLCSCPWYLPYTRTIQQADNNMEKWPGGLQLQPLQAVKTLRCAAVS